MFSTIRLISIRNVNEDESNLSQKPPKSTTSREIAELRIELALEAAKNNLRESNQEELRRLSRNEHEPKFKKLRNSAALVIAFLILTNLWAWFGIKERVKNQATEIIDKKLINPQLTNSLQDALSKQAVPFIAAQLHPIETNILDLRANLQSLTRNFADLDISFRKARQQLDEQMDFVETMSGAQLYDSDAYRRLQAFSESTNSMARQAERTLSDIQRRLRYNRVEAIELVPREKQASYEFLGPFMDDEVAQNLEMGEIPKFGQITLENRIGPFLFPNSCAPHSHLRTYGKLTGSPLRCPASPDKSSYLGFPSNSPIGGFPIAIPTRIGPML